MEENKEDYYSLDSIVNIIRTFLFYLLKKWWLLLIAAIGGIALGIGYYSIQKPKYEAITTFILEEKTAGGGGLAGIASQFGFDIGSLSGGGSIFAGDNILDILKSRKIAEKVLLTKVDKDKVANSETLADLFLDFMGWKKKWFSDPNLRNLTFSNVDKDLNLTLAQDSVLNLMHDFLLKRSLSVERLNKKGSIIKVQVTSLNSLFAKLMADRLVEESGKLYLNIKTGTAQANIDRMQRRSDSLLAILNNKSYKVAATQLLDVNPGVKSAIVPIEIATRDKAVIGTLYTEITKNLETGKLLLSQQTPVIQVLDIPSLPLQDKRRSMLVSVEIGLLISFLIVLLPLGIIFLFNIRKKQVNNF